MTRSRQWEMRRWFLPRDPSKTRMQDDCYGDLHPDFSHWVNCSCLQQIMRVIVLCFQCLIVVFLLLFLYWVWKLVSKDSQPNFLPKRVIPYDERMISQSFLMIITSSFLEKTSCCVINKKWVEQNNGIDDEWLLVLNWSLMKFCFSFLLFNTKTEWTSEATRGTTSFLLLLSLSLSS
jgi:hypothetical protein